MRARVNKQQAREGLLQALSCRPGAECAKPIIAELLDAGVIRPTSARNYAIIQRYTATLAAPGVTPAKALDVVCVEFDLSERTIRRLVGR